MCFGTFLFEGGDSWGPAFVQLRKSAVRRHGNLLRAWRGALDTSGDGWLSYLEFCNSVRAEGSARAREAPRDPRRMALAFRRDAPAIALHGELAQSRARNFVESPACSLPNWRILIAHFKSAVNRSVGYA